LGLGLRYWGVRPSALQDVLVGRRTEVQLLNGAIVRHGQAKGVATPVNEALIRRVEAIEAGKGGPSPSAYGEIEMALSRAALTG
jgi:2-dehydropantoate 2-reductase